MGRLEGWWWRGVCSANPNAVQIKGQVSYRSSPPHLCPFVKIRAYSWLKTLHPSLKTHAFNWGTRIKGQVIYLRVIYLRSGHADKGTGHLSPVSYLQGQCADCQCSPLRRPSRALQEGHCRTSPTGSILSEMLLITQEILLKSAPRTPKKPRTRNVPKRP